jgi:hypothetical protein
MTKVENNYSTIEKEALVMIYVIKKFHHYLLGNNFTFFVDHQTLIYLVNKPTITRQIDAIIRSGKGPIQLVIAFEPFMKWGLDYTGPIKTLTRYTITTIL